MEHTDGHGAHDAHHHGHAVFGDERFALTIAAEGESARPITAQAIERAARVLHGGDRAAAGRVADLGCGAGVEACALAAAFPGATVAAVDGSSAMRAATRARAGEEGVADRVVVGAVDLEGDLSSLGAFDLVWMAQALHHLDDEAAALARVAALLEPGGALCLLERLDPLELRPADDLGRPGIWERVAGAYAAWHGHRPADASSPGPGRYAELVGLSGLDIADSGPLRAVATLGSTPGAGFLVTRYVDGALRNLADRLAAADIDALRTLDAVHAARLLPVEVRQSRTLVIGVRPGQR
jgi:SAM-dependent methyltransferase